MTESWALDDDPRVPLTPTAVLGTLRARMEAGRAETWLTGSSGRLLTVVTNTERAMVALLDGEGDPGGHAVDPGAAGTSRGFVLSNGQHDAYADEDTVPLAEAFRIVWHLVREGSPPADASWTVDR
ncbi:hypothetical protein ACFYXS_28575 [Streptomyces sp. NPDC002574]|uniref:hypothetical protein n=1 Tax=Streptomyces sp. NPDC002574 TaxID=3364652 RepID=UPI0036869491